MRILINRSSGADRRGADDAVEALRAALPFATLVPLEEGRTCEELLGYEPRTGPFGACGGDGTINAVAACAIAVGVPLLVIPGGTRNHFAHDLGIDDTDAAVEAATCGRSTAVDVGEIDGRLFLNNASLGVYAHLVRVRERWEHRIGKRMATVLALCIVVARGQPLHLEIDGRPRRLWCAWFGNNLYDEQGLFAPIGRTSLTGGVLDVRLLSAERRLARTRLVATALLRRVEASTVYEAMQVDRVTVSGDGRLSVAVDGEIFDAVPDFEVRVRPKALHVMVPRRETPGE